MIVLAVLGVGVFPTMFGFIALFTQHDGHSLFAAFDLLALFRT